MGWFSKSSSSGSGSTRASRKSRNRPVHTEPVLTRAELEARTKAQRDGNFMDPGRGGYQETTGRTERVI